MKTQKIDYPHPCKKRPESPQQVDNLEENLNAAKSAEGELLETNSRLDASLSHNQSMVGNLSCRISKLEEQAQNDYSNEARLQRIVDDLTEKLRSSRSEEGALIRKLNRLGASFAFSCSKKEERQQQLLGSERTRTAELTQDRKLREEQAESVHILELSKANLANDLRSIEEMLKETVDENTRLKSFNDSLSEKVVISQKNEAKLQACIDDNSGKLSEALALTTWLRNHNASMKSVSDHVLQ